jgi:hypothetical protein
MAIFHLAEKPMEGWQQFVVHARDERGDPVTDYLIEVLRREDGNWVKFEEMYTDVHAYAADPSFRCFHIRLPEGISSNVIPLRVRIHASTGTELITYQGYGSTVEINLQADSAPVELDITGLGPDGKDSLFHPFTTTMIEIVLNRDPNAPRESPKGIFQDSESFIKSLVLDQDLRSRVQRIRVLRFLFSGPCQNWQSFVCAPFPLANPSQLDEGGQVVWPATNQFFEHLTRG